MNARRPLEPLWLLAIALAANGATCGGTAQPVPRGDGDAPAVSPDAGPAPHQTARDAGVLPEGSAPPPDRAPVDGPPARDTAATTLPPPTGDCAAPGMCQALATEYEMALGRAASCMVGQDQACRLKVATTLRCGSCEAWVSDDKELAEIRGRFVAEDCAGCSFRLRADGTCASGPCVPLTTPMCAGNAGVAPTLPTTGTCGNAGGERVCPDGLRTGGSCAPPDYCLGGGYLVCSCGVDRKWTCV